MNILQQIINDAVLVGMGVGGLIILIIIFVCFYVYRRNKNRNQERHMTPRPGTPDTDPATDVGDGSRQPINQSYVPNPDEDKPRWAWLTNILLFVPRLIMEVLDAVHTKKFKYYGLILALLAIEAFFAFRASIVYHQVLEKTVPAWELFFISIIIFVAIFLSGYMIATHRPENSAGEEESEEEAAPVVPATQPANPAAPQQPAASQQPVNPAVPQQPAAPQQPATQPAVPQSPQSKIRKKTKAKSAPPRVNWFSRWTIAAIVLLHDWSGTFYMNYGSQHSVDNVQTSDLSTSLLQQIATAWQSGQWLTGLALIGSFDYLKLLLTIGMCAVGLFPFVMGRWAEELRPQMLEEQEREVNEFTQSAVRKIKRRAVSMVLRQVGHTDVVHLVRALPRGEFDDFKAFVLPIIAPGTTKYHLDTGEENPLKELELIQPDSKQDQQEESQNQDPKFTDPQSHLNAPASVNVATETTGSPVPEPVTKEPDPVYQHPEATGEDSNGAKTMKPEPALLSYKATYAQSHKGMAQNEASTQNYKATKTTTRPSAPSAPSASSVPSVGNGSAMVSNSRELRKKAREEELETTFLAMVNEGLGLNQMSGRAFHSRVGGNRDLVSKWLEERKIRYIAELTGPKPSQKGTGHPEKALVQNQKETGKASHDPAPNESQSHGAMASIESQSQGEGEPRPSSTDTAVMNEETEPVAEPVALRAVEDKNESQRQDQSHESTEITKEESQEPEPATPLIVEATGKDKASHSDDGGPDAPVQEPGTDKLPKVEIPMLVRSH